MPTGHEIGLKVPADGRTRVHAYICNIPPSKTRCGVRIAPFFQLQNGKIIEVFSHDKNLIQAGADFVLK